MSDISDSDQNSSEGLEYASEGLEYASEPEGSLSGSSGTTPAASTKRCASPKGGRNSKWSRSESSTPDSRVITSTKETPSRTPKPVHQVRRHIRVTSQKQQPNPQICGTEVLAALGEVTTTLSKLVDRLDRQESQLKSLEEKISNPSSSTEGKEILKVPAIVRVSCSILL